MNKEKQKGSITVEASLLMPIFISMILFFLYFFQIMLIQEKVSIGLWETAKEISKYGYIYDAYGVEGMEPDSYKVTTQQLIGGILTGERMKSYVSDALLEQSCVKGKSHGILYTTELDEESKEVYAKASYDVELPLFRVVLPSMHYVQQAKTKLFVGTSQIGSKEGEEDADDEKVYVTKTGKENSIYHASITCSHLDLKIQTTTIKQVGSMRNQYGAKYKPCEKCVKNAVIAEGEVIYVTTDGNRYHSKIGCSGLKRDVSEVKLSEIPGYRPCSRCGS